LLPDERRINRHSDENTGSHPSAQVRARQPPSAPRPWRRLRAPPPWSDCASFAAAAQRGCPVSSDKRPASAAAGVATRASATCTAAHAWHTSACATSPSRPWARKPSMAAARNGRANTPSRTYPAEPAGTSRRRPLIPARQLAKSPAHAGNPAYSGQPGDAKTGLSRRRSRVRVPSLPFSKLPAKRLLFRSRARGSAFVRRPLDA
jgi:hypothetical protein